MQSPVTLSKRILREALSQFGLELRRKAAPLPSPRNSAAAMFKSAAAAGLKPRTLIDVGVANGTNALYDAYPEARLLLVEPLIEYQTALETIVAARPGSQYAIAAAGSTPGRVILNVHPDLYGSSLYREDEDSNVNGVEREVEALLLDDLCESRKMLGPYVLKVDVQGAERDVLNGAKRVLEDTDLVCLEVSLFEFFKGAPQFADIIGFMRDAGFVPYDIYDGQYRPLDGAMSQIDIAFVRERGLLRRHHFYATRAQRTEHNILASSEGVGVSKAL